MPNKETRKKAQGIIEKALTPEAAAATVAQGTIQEALTEQVRQQARNQNIAYSRTQLGEPTTIADVVKEGKQVKEQARIQKERDRWARKQGYASAPPSPLEDLKKIARRKIETVARNKGADVILRDGKLFVKRLAGPAASMYQMGTWNAQAPEQVERAAEATLPSGYKIEQTDTGFKTVEKAPKRWIYVDPIGGEEYAPEE